MKERTIAKLKYENNTFKLLEITYENGKVDKDYLIVKNRKRISWTVWEGVAKHKFANLIAGELLQTKITL